MLKFTSKVFLLVFFCLSTQLWAKESLHAHDHGHVTLAIAIENKNIEIELDSPAESFLGFEYAPKTAKEKETWANAELLWKKKFFDIFELRPELKCQLIKNSFLHKLEDHGKSHHSEIEGRASIMCEKKITGYNIKINLKKYFPKIVSIKTEIIGEQSKSFVIKSPSQELSL